MRKLKFFLMFCSLISVFFIFNINEVKANQKSIMHIDTPIVEHDINQEVVINGWFVNSSGTKEVEVWLNGNKIGIANLNELRPDVNKAFPGYSQKDNAGFKYSLGKLTTGDYTLQINGITNSYDGTNDNEVISLTKRFQVIRKKSIMHIDFPTDKQVINPNTTQSVMISGWTLNSEGTEKVEVLVDNQLIEKATINQSRPDVNQVIPGYKDGANSGYSYNLPIANLKSGNRIITVRTTTKDNEVYESSKQVEIAKRNARMSFDSFYVNQTITRKMINNNQGKIELAGWFLSDSGTKSIEIFSESTKLGDANLNIYRPDVNKAVPGYQQENHSGYNYILDAARLSDGIHKLIIKATAHNGETVSIERNLIIGKPRIILDPGHGGRDTGAIGYGHIEKNINLDMGLRLGATLQNLGFEVILLRGTDTDFYLNNATERGRFIGRNIGSLAISIHANSTGSANEKSGAELIVPYGITKSPFSHMYHKTFSELYNFREIYSRNYNNSKIDVRSLSGDTLNSIPNYPDYYGVIRGSYEYKTPTYITEMFYINNIEDVNFYFNNQNEYIKALAKSVCYAFDYDC